jgi:hypothetical protein
MKYYTILTALEPGKLSQYTDYTTGWTMGSIPGRGNDGTGSSLPSSKVAGA